MHAYVVSGVNISARWISESPFAPSAGLNPPDKSSKRVSLQISFDYRHFCASMTDFMLDFNLRKSYYIYSYFGLLQ